MKAIQVSFS
jgi:hypothetical protein